jgi:hypothetical protein
LPGSGDPGRCRKAEVRVDTAVVSAPADNAARRRLEILGRGNFGTWAEFSGLLFRLPAPATRDLASHDEVARCRPLARPLSPRPTSVRYFSPRSRLRLLSTQSPPSDQRPESIGRSPKVTARCSGGRRPVDHDRESPAWASVTSPRSAQRPAQPPPRRSEAQPHWITARDERLVQDPPSGTAPMGRRSRRVRVMGGVVLVLGWGSVCGRDGPRGSQSVTGRFESGC